MNSVVLVQSQGSGALVRIVRLQKFDRRGTTCSSHIPLNRLIDENTPLEQSTIETCLQEAYNWHVQESCENFLWHRFKVRSKDWTASRWWARWRSQSSSCQHCVITWHDLIPADHEYLDTVAWLLHDCRDHGWFFKPQLFPTKIILLKRGTLQLSNAKKFSLIRQGMAKLQEFKVERFWESFVTVTMGKSRFDGTERLAFRPWQRFICIHSDVGAGDRRRPICCFSPFGSSCALCTGLVSFVRTQDEGAMCPKITISMMLPEILKLANSVGPGGLQLLCQLQGHGAWFGDSLKADPETPWPKAGKANTCFVPLHSLLLGFEIVVRSFHAHRFRAEVVRWQKNASRQQKQAETNLIIQFARKRSLRHRLPSANSLAPKSAPADFAETWYLD